MCHHQWRIGGGQCISPPPHSPISKVLSRHYCHIVRTNTRTRGPGTVVLLHAIQFKLREAPDVIVVGEFQHQSDIFVITVIASAKLVARSYLFVAQCLRACQELGLTRNISTVSAKHWSGTLGFGRFRFFPQSSGRHLFVIAVRCKPQFLGWLETTASCEGGGGAGLGCDSLR